MSLKAVGDSVLLKEVNIEEKTEAGLIIKSKQLHPIYEVVCIGEDIDLKTPNGENELKVGDYVMIPLTVGNNVVFENKTYKYCKYWEILCKVEV